MSLDNISDERNLLVNLRDGDYRSFDILYDRYAGKLTANLLRLLKSPELTEEILQELFLKIWETRNQIDPEKSFRSYLFRIAHNMVYQTFRESARQRRLEDYLMASTSGYTNALEEGIHHKEMEALFRQAIEKLPPKRREVYKLFKLEGKSYEEISQQLQISASTINDHLQKANQFLKSQIGRETMSILVMVYLFRPF